MGDRPPELIRLDISRPGSERDAIKGNRDLAALHGEGWDIGYCWITVVHDPRSGDTDQQILNVIMVPPRPDALSGLRQQIEALQVSSADLAASSAAWERRAAILVAVAVALLVAQVVVGVVL